MIRIHRGAIASISPMSKGKGDPAATQVLDIAGDWVSLGGVDLQINGALGLAFTDVDAEQITKIREICQFLWHQGIDAFLPTLVTTAVEKIQRSLSIFSDCADFGQQGAQILGVHLEGPFLNPTKRGAHPAEHLLPLTIENVKRVLGDYAGMVKVMTLAPELDAIGKVIPYLRDLGITVSLGHSQATAAEAENAFARGASMVTHAFNAMPSLNHREPGLLGAALVNDRVKCGLIADGQHVCPTMMYLLARCHPQGIFLVSDALAPLGLPDGIYPWDKRQIRVENGTARLLDGALAGTSLPLLAGVQNLVKWGIRGVPEAIAWATEAPRRAIGLPGLAPNTPANLLRWHFDEYTRELTWQRLGTEN
ncbi:MAG: N-acetylglucosamine-6-phosphate deacetylase [Hormoscilla sp.]